MATTKMQEQRLEPGLLIICFCGSSGLRRRCITWNLRNLHILYGAKGWSCWENIWTWRKALAGLKPQALTIPCNEGSIGAGKRAFQLLVEALIFKITTVVDGGDWHQDLFWHHLWIIYNIYIIHDWIARPLSILCLLFVCIPTTSIQYYLSPFLIDYYWSHIIVFLFFFAPPKKKLAFHGPTNVLYDYSNFIFLFQFSFLLGFIAVIVIL